MLDTGCGRGLIALNVATWYNTSVVGINIDETQVAHAKRLAFDAHMENRLEFIQQGGIFLLQGDSDGREPWLGWLRFG